MYNSKEFLDASTKQVKETLIIAFILVALVVFVFLQDFRSTLIPAIAVPVAIVGTFFLFAIIRIQHQPAYIICPGISNRYCS
jgi:multidrug efflux pump subunit AcrB